MLARVQSSPVSALGKGEVLLVLLGVSFSIRPADQTDRIAQGPLGRRLLATGPSRQVAPVTPGCPLGLSTSELVGARRQRAGKAWEEGRCGWGWPESCSDTSKFVMQERGQLTCCALWAHSAGGGQKSRGWEAAGHPCWVAQRNGRVPGEEVAGLQSTLSATDSASRPSFRKSKPQSPAITKTGCS